MQAYKAKYEKDGNTDYVTILDVYTDGGGDLGVIYFTNTGEVDKDEARYFTIIKPVLVKPGLI